jgi:adenylate kinase
MHKYIIMGVQGSGKGTQAKMLKDELDLVHISIGDIFRWNIQNHTKLAAKVKRIVTTGALVPDEVVNALVQSRLAEHDWNFGFILDGFPRNTPQAEFCLENYDIDAVIQIDLPDQVVMDRILNRRLCAKCGRDFNILFNPPKKADTCDVCGGALKARPDDNPTALKARLADYHNQTAPVLALIGKKERIVRVDGTKKPEDVYAEIRRQLGLGAPKR